MAALSATVLAHFEAFGFVPRRQCLRLEVAGLHAAADATVSH